jgi:hypothetical protein
MKSGELTMPTMLPNAAVMARTNQMPLDAKLSGFGATFNAMALVLLPPLLALLVAAGCLGHGQISSESILSALQAIGDANL